MRRRWWREREGGQVNVERKRCMGEVRKEMMEREKKATGKREEEPYRH